MGYFRPDIALPFLESGEPDCDCNVDDAPTETLLEEYTDDDEPSDRIGISSIKAIKNGICDLWRYQQQHQSNANPDPNTPEVQGIFMDMRRQLNLERDRSFTDRGKAGMNGGITDTEFKAVGRQHWQSSNPTNQKKNRT